MLEILYRIYQVATEEERELNLEKDNNFGLFGSTSKAENNELLMDCMVCDNRDQFKQIIKDMYGEDISFRYSKKLNSGDLYCIIIGEHCYNSERYFTKIKYKCDQCGCDVESVLDKSIKFSSYELSRDMYNNSDAKDKKFCSHSCKDTYKSNNSSPNDTDEFWVDNTMFNRKNIIGYIYKITKRSTGEFYIGQTKYVPIFRWGQHLKTDRFDLNNILDYTFETIYEVKSGENILEVEKKYIKEYIELYGSKLSLNVVHNK